MGAADYDGVAIDLEHGAIAVHQVPDLCRAHELGGALVRVAQGSVKDCKQALDAGCGGIIVPMAARQYARRGVRARQHVCAVF